MNWTRSSTPSTRPGYGLTLGIHSRIDDTINHIVKRSRVGNCYVNRNQIGAVVGVQPFGGENLSGTGPKAGGPHYLLRFRHRTNRDDQYHRSRRQRVVADVGGVAPWAPAKCACSGEPAGSQ